MSQNHAVLIDELWNETERLQARVAELQSQLAQHSEPDKREEPREQNEDVWNVWPYSWAQSGWNGTRDFLAHRFHSLHEKHLELCNKRAQRAFWQTPHPEDIEIKLV